MPASKRSKFEAKMRRDHGAAQRSATPRERANDLPRNPGLDGPHYSSYYGIPGSSISADDLDRRLKLREEQARGQR
jgi:hypothetical protein